MTIWIYRPVPPDSSRGEATRRVFPGFNEEYYGHASFADLLEDLREKGYLEIDFDEKRGNYVVRSPRPA